MQRSPKVEDSLLRVRDIVGDPKSGTPGILPIGRSTWWAGVRAGRFPQPVRLGTGTTCWRLSDVQKLVAGNDDSSSAADGAR